MTDLQWIRHIAERACITSGEASRLYTIAKELESLEDMAKLAEEGERETWTKWELAGWLRAHSNFFGGDL
jgi:hypothetical protein